MNLLEHKFLNSFFNLFEAKAEITKIDNKSIYGILNWENEDDTQDFKWSNDFDDKTLSILKDFCDFLLENQLTKGDKIIVSEDILKEKLIGAGWSNDKTKKGIDSLMSLEVKMVDEGEETDSFFIHF
tara:strand:- start:141 stop:521 length:381 start_codon:yes stop_codon:yes gene_type:complete